jgi:hypothetical protein
MPNTCKTKTSKPAKSTSQLLRHPAAMEVCFLASGEPLATLDAVKFEAQVAKILKQTLAPELGVSSFLDLLKIFFSFLDQSTIGKLGIF